MPDRRKDETGIVVYAPGKSDWSYSIPEGITTIYSGAFWACDNLHRITVPGSVNFIDEVAFGNVPSRQPEQIIFEGNPPDMSYKAFGSLIISGSEYWRTIYYPAQNANWESWLVSNESNWNNYCIDFKSYTDVNDISTEMASGSYGDLEWCLKLDGELYITGKGDMEEASSSSSYPWSIYRSDIKRVVIGDEVTSIAKSAFESYNIIELVLGESVKSIGEKAFAYCENLKGNLLLPNSVESVGYMAFWYSGFDGNLVLPENIAEIGSGAFGYSNFTGNLIIPNTIQKIEIGAFQNCSGFTGDLIIPDSVTEIGRMAFGYCGFDGKIVLPDGLEIIDEYVFDGCDKLSGELVLPKTVKSIGWCAFFGCSSFTGDLIIPESVTMIDGGAFYGCSGFSGKLVVPESVSSVGENAFRGCTGLEGQVYISEHLASAEPTAFELLYEVDMDKPDDEEEAASTRGEVTVYAPKGSYAEEYANTNGYMYVEWDGTEVIVQNPFVDVLEGAFYHDAVLWASDNEITKGYGQENTFCPENTCTRGQIVTFLWRANGSPEPASMNNPFTDVKSSDYYYKAVLWAVENGITAGYGSDTIFNPDGACTRGQVATFLWRAEGKPGMSHATNPFTDVKPGEFYYDAVLWAVENGITNGYGSDTIFNPDGVCTRGQIVTFLYRAMK